ncbi:MAG: ABC transporter ATP-binding protein [Chloroflexi bacterium]|nr:ABC transporter ATP-binding protein [Chloroflexota bacterium]
MSEVKLAAVDVRLVRGSRSVLDVPRLDVHRGEVLAVVGPNGAGKSSLLNVLALLEKPSQGRVVFDGEPVAGDPLSYRRRMAVVFQEPLLLDTTVEANVRSGLALRGVPRDEQERRMEHWLRRFGIQHLRRRSAYLISGGEAQRTSLARALVLEPEVLLLDEPFGGLDAPARQSLLDDLEAALRETGTTTVFVTHDRGEALRLGRRVAVMMDGRIRQVCPTEEVFASPVDEEVAAFVGVETIVPGLMRTQEGGLAVIEVTGRSIEAVADSSVRGEVLVCLRPEDVVLAPGSDSASPTSARNRLRAKVRRIVPVGPQVRVELDCGFHLVALITKQSLEDLSLRPGDEVVASFKATAVHVIPRRGGS